MIKATLDIRCWNCGIEERIIEYLDDGAITFNADKPCPHCLKSEMLTKELTMKPDISRN